MAIFVIMPTKPKPNFFKELKRRNVYKVAITYAIVAWLVIQISVATFPLLNLPAWTSTFIVVLFIIGFPIALILAWAFEMSPEGMIRTTSVEAEENPYPDSKKKPLTSNLIIGILLLALVGQFMYNKYWGSGEPDSAGQVAVAEIGKSIAVLPFTNMSSDPEQEYFSDGISEEIINVLAQIPDLKVSSRTSAFQFRGETDIKTIGETLGVATVLEGSIRKSQNTIRVMVQLINVADGFHLWSQTYERELVDIFAIQDELSKSILGTIAMSTSNLTSTKPASSINGSDSFRLTIVFFSFFLLALLTFAHISELFFLAPPKKSSIIFTITLRLIFELHFQLQEVYEM